MLTRCEIIEGIDFLGLDDEFMAEIQYVLRDAVENFDLELVVVLLKIGADPNKNPSYQYKERNHGFLHDLILKYEANRTIHGEKILAIYTELLKSGADPNQSGDCNMAPIQRCTNKVCKPIKDLLLEFGARPHGNSIF